ncbi:hypothetical protein 7t3_081 [Salmonella phage 7t3]|nr:hypothetical protein 7t3_081 [Salmonella phage 7t3]
MNSYQTLLSSIATELLFTSFSVIHLFDYVNLLY